MSFEERWQRWCEVYPQTRCASSLRMTPDTFEESVKWFYERGTEDERETWKTTVAKEMSKP